MTYEEQEIPGYTVVDADCPADPEAAAENTGEDIRSYG
jgi:hypothetical protein